MSIYYDDTPDTNTEAGTETSVVAPETDPDAGPGTELIPDEAVEGEVLTAEQIVAVDRRIAIGRRVPALRSTTAVVRRVAASPRPGQAARGVVRHGRYVAAGASEVTGRWRDAHGPGRFERQMRAAEAAGDHDRLADWHARAEHAKQARHQRHQAWLEAPGKLAKAAAAGVLGVLALLTLVGLLWAGASGDITAFIDPFTGVLSLVRFVGTVVAILWTPVLILGPLIAVLWLWARGRATDPTPPGTPAAASAEGAGRDVVPDEGAILGALRNLNLTPLNRKIKEGWLPRWVLPTGRDGKGWRTQLELPPGVTVEMINNRKGVLAHNLVRLPVEVWPTEPKNQPGVLDLWVADQGLLTGPVEQHPLLESGSADYFTGVPVGVDQRGGQVRGKLMGCNHAVAGTMGSGKTAYVVCLLCGVMLDPLVDIDVYVLAYNADYDPLQKRLRTLVKGDDDEQIVAAMDALRGLRGEVTERGKILSELGGEETKLTRKIAEADPRMRPRVVVFDECQELFRHERYGDEAKQLAIKVMMKARKCGITLVWVTPVPSADSLPRDLAKTISHGVCYAIGDHQGNDAILGTGAHKQGITATTLVPGEDVGTAMAFGFGPRPGLLRSYHLRKERGTDHITPMVTRALAAREDAGITSEPADPVPADEVDPLADIAAVLGDTSRMRTHEVLHGLATRNPSVYGQWTFTDLKHALPEGAKPFKTDGTVKVLAARVHKALTDRNHAGRANPDSGEPEP